MVKSKKIKKSLSTEAIIKFLSRDFPHYPKPLRGVLEPELKGIYRLKERIDKKMRKHVGRHGSVVNKKGERVFMSSNRTGTIIVRDGVVIIVVD